MANIIFASNNIAHMLGAEVSTTVNTFDPDLVPYSLKVSSGSLAAVNFAKSLSSETWTHFRMSSPTVPGTDFKAVYYNVFSLVERTTNKVLLKMEFCDDSGPRLTMHNGTSTVTGTLPAFTFIQDIPVTVDIRYESSPTEITITVFFNNAQLYRTTLTVVGTSPGQFDQIVFYNGWTYVKYSEIIVADADTRNARLAVVKPASTGFHSGWDGLLTDLVDDNPITGMSTTAPATKLTANLETYTGGALISNLVTASMVSSGVNGPTNLQHMVRHAGVDYNGASIPVSDSVEVVFTDWTVNPGTALPWTGADLAVTEFGFESIV